MDKERFLREYEIFKQAGHGSSSLPNDSVFLHLKKKLGKDLIYSPSRFAALYLGLSSIGYVASLLICAQNTFGFSSIAHKVAEHLHQLPDPWCAIACGAVFTGIPYVLARVFLNRFQHRYLIFRMWWFFALIPVVTTAFMVFLPQNMQHTKMRHIMHSSNNNFIVWGSVSWIVVWAMSAILFPYLIELFTYVLSRLKKRNSRFIQVN